MSVIKWIKITTDIFDNRKIKQIRKLPEGDALIGVWLQIICLAGSTNDNGLIYITKDIPFTEETLAIEFDRPINIIKLAVEVFKRFNMVDIVDDFLFVTNWIKYQNIDGLEKIKEQTRKRVSLHREKQKMLGNVTRNVTVTECNATDIEEDIDIELDKEINIDTSEAATSASVPYKQIMQHFNSICQKASKIRGIEGTRKKAVAARWKANNDIEIFITLFKKTEESKFLNGENERNWQVDFDWLMKPQNMTKVLEGRYDNKTASQSYKPRGKQEIVPEWLQEGYKQPETTLSSKTTTDIENELERLLKGEK